MTEGSNSGRHEDAPGLSWRMGVETEKCSLCEVCVRRCKSGAVWSEQDGDTLVLLFRSELCDGCGDCVKICPEQAMTLVASDAPPGGSGKEVLMAGGMLRCTVCGNLFAASAKLEAAARRREDDAELVRDECPLCRRTQMVATFIDERREGQGKPAEYRTGKKWSWKPVVDGDRDAPPCPESFRDT